MKFFSLLRALAYLGSGAKPEDIMWVVSPTDFKTLEEATAFYRDPVFMSQQELTGVQFLPQIWDRVYQPRLDAYTYFFLENGRPMYDLEYSTLPSEKLWPTWLRPYLTNNNLESK